MASTTNMGGSTPMVPDASNSYYLTTEGYNMTNSTDMMDFLNVLTNGRPFGPLNKLLSVSFWYAVVIVIGIATFINFSSKLTLRARLRAAAVKRPYPAKPDNPYTKLQALMTAAVREVTYPQFALDRFSWVPKTPPTGVALLLILYFSFLVGLELVQDFVPGAYYYQALGLRAGWLSTTQLSLLIILVGKHNFLGFLTGVSHERLNILHRWVARGIWLTVTLHWALMQQSWTIYGVASLEITTDPAYPTGVAAWSILTWINISSIAPIRNWQYEIFVLQHILCFIGFFAAVLLHIPVDYAKTYVYIPIALYIFDRLVRGVCFAYVNSRLGRATVTALPCGVSKVRVQSLRLKKWHAGQHVLLSIPRFGILQSHPATILSTPSSHGGDLVFILKAHKGFTGRLNKSATASKESGLTTKEISKPPAPPHDQGETGQLQLPNHLAFVSGPYGCSHVDFACFSSALFVAGATGITFTLPLLLDLAERAQTKNLPVRRISFVWIIKSYQATSWVSEELETAVSSLHKAGIICEVSIFISAETRLETSDQDPSSEKVPGCQCTDTNATCSCNRNIPVSLQSKDENTILHTRAVSPGSNSKEGQLIRAHSGRPNIEQILWEVLECAEGETAVAVCGPFSLGVRCRKAVSSASIRRGVHKGTGAQGVYLHVEGFSW